MIHNIVEVMYYFQPYYSVFGILL